MTYYSQAWQDEFVANLLNFKRNGYYLDIGSSTPIDQSNTYFFDSELNWKGICVEKNPDYNQLYKEKRTCHFVNDDAIKIDYKKLLKKYKCPLRIDYLSVDVDEWSSKALSALPLDTYRFNVVTCEHDAYLHGDLLRNQERECLRYYNYILLFSDTFVPLGCSSGQELRFEDWWIDPIVFNMEKLSKIGGEKMYPDDIVAMIKSKKEVWTKNNL